MKKKKGWQSYNCIYCNNGQSGKLGDHAVAKAFFPQDEFGNLFGNPKLVTAPACKDCNISFRNDEMYLRDVLIHSCDIDALYDYESKNGFFIAIDKGKRIVRRSLHSIINNPLVLSEFKENLCEMDVYTESGLYIGKYPARKASWDKMKRVLAKTFKNLYFNVFGEPLANDNDVIVVNVEDIKNTKHFESVVGMLKREGKTQVLAENIFKFIWLELEFNLPSRHVCFLLEYYNRAQFLCYNFDPKYKNEKEGNAIDDMFYKNDNRIISYCMTRKRIDL